MTLEYLIFLLPIVFMIHDFEEIISFRRWLLRNSGIVEQKFPKLSKRILPHLKTLSTEAFTLAVAEEFVLISTITCLAVYYQYYVLWFAAFSAFSIHLLLHIIQWLALRRYVPSIITSLLLLPYCIYTFKRFIDVGKLSSNDMIVWSAVGLILMVANIFLAHWMARVYENKRHI